MPEPLPTPEQLAATHAGFVHALALRLAPAPGLAEDIAQQVLLEFLAKAGTWDLTAEIKPLLAGMTRNVARRAWRDKTREMPEAMCELAEHIRELAEGQDVQWFSDEEKSALRRCLGRLPDKSRRLIELHYYLDVTSVEIGRQMDTNADAVRRALFRLREQLRKCVQRLLGESLA
jgi:RNA polymerase sigma-70 factor (ECF subfamily)